MQPSRLQIDESTQLPSIQTFGELSNFLRSSMGDEECLQLGESMAALASQIEQTVAAMAQPATAPSRPDIPGFLIDLLTLLREHHAMVVGLGAGWRGLYEYAAYLSALNNFRVLVAQWLRNGPDAGERPEWAPDFERVAWRVLGEGMLMLDMYEQWRGYQRATEAEQEADPRRVRQARSWWDRLRG